jgi:ferredoxin-NADP reductase
MEARLVSWTDIAPEARHFEFEVPGQEKFTFEPGQFVRIMEEHDGKRRACAYSIASPRNGNRFALCLGRGSRATSRMPSLFSREPGAEVEIGPPAGNFTLKRPDRRAVFVATGTAIAPFRSMLLDHLPAIRGKITLLFGVRHEDGLLYRAEFEDLAARHEGFQFLPTVSRPSARWAGRTGRVHLHLKEALGSKRREDLEMTDVYLCGAREMVSEARLQLEREGLKPRQIIYEDCR